jgi:hypothetical protein
MAKPAIKDILLQKGEKIAIGIGLGLLGLLLLLGLIDVVSAESPDKKAKEFETKAAQIKREVDSPGGDAEPLAPWVTAVKNTSSIPAEEFAASGTIFEPVHQPDFLRENPPVLGILDYQIDLIRAPMPALDVQENPGGEPRIGVLANAKTGDKNSRNVLKEVRSAMQMKDRKSNLPQRRQPTRPGFPPGGFPPGGGGFAGGQPPGGGKFPGAGGGFPGAAGGGMGTGSPESGGGGGGYNPYGMGMGMGMGEFAASGPRDDRSVVYLTPDEVEKKGLPLAQTVYPLRALLIQAAFPLKLQIKANREALRMPEGKTPLAGGGVPGYGAAYGGYGMGQPGPGAGGPGGPGLGSPESGGAPGGGVPGMTMPPGVGGTAGGSAAFANSVYPHYAGIEVERRILPLGAKDWSDWTPYDHENDYFTKIRARKWEDDPDTGYLLYFLPPYDQRMVAPLPKLADDLAKWPDLNMPEIRDNIKKLEEAGRPKITPTEWEKRFGSSAGGENPYAPVGAGTYGRSGYGGMSGLGSPESGGPGGPGGFGAAGGPVMPPGGVGPLGRPGAGVGAGMPGKPGVGGPGGPAGMGVGGPGGLAGSTAPPPEVEWSLLRFFDVDAAAHPGWSYQYRIRVKMKNPNFGQKTAVSRPADAKVEVLYGPWVELKDVVTIPPETFLYAADSDQYIKQVQDLYEQNGKERPILKVMEQDQVRDGKRAVVQFQTWLPQIRIDGSNKTEPIGSWVVADMPVAPGEFVGRRQLVELPLWSAGLASYVLRELTGGVRIAGIARDKHQPKGWPVNFRTLSVLVDFEGGRVKAQVGDRSVTEDSATEVLILRPDGKLLVRNSEADKNDPDRKARQDTWDNWLKRVKERKEATPAGPMAPGGGFGRPGAGGPGGPGA